MICRVNSGYGLSPLARGTHVRGQSWEPTERFIPAGAGNTGSVFEVVGETPVYPRWRGEHYRRATLAE